MTHVDLPAFYLGVQEELEKLSRCWEGYEPVPGKEAYSEDSCRPKGKKKEKKAETLQTSVPNETPEQFLSRVRTGKYNLPKFMQNASQHSWSIPGVPFANSMIHGFINSNMNNPEAVKNKINAQDDPTLLKVINKNPEAFKGVQNQQAQPIAAKVAVDINGMPVNENILPNLGGQAKWKYVRTKDGLKLSDGNLVYSFGGFPENYPAEDYKVSRGDDDNILNFENDAVSKGTAQIHRASPDNIYMTLANGAENPTFMLQHEEGKNWRYSPAKKFMEKLKKMQQASTPSAPAEHKDEAPVHQDSTLLDPEALFEGAADYKKEAMEGYVGKGLLDADSAAELINSTINQGRNLTSSAITGMSNHPVGSMLGTYLALKGVGKVRDLLNPDREVERAQDPKLRMRHELLPVLGAAAPTMASLMLRAK